MVTIHYNRCTQDSADRLVDRLGTDMQRSDHLVINWGVSDGGRTERDELHLRTILNHPDKVATAVNKPKAINLMLRHGISTPPIRQVDYTLRSVTIAEEGQWVVRPNEHSEGSDFRVMRAPFSLAAGHYATRFIPDTREYRVWFTAHDPATTIISTMMAKRVPMASRGQSDNDACRSSFGYAFTSRGSDFSLNNMPKLKEQVQKVVNTFGLNYGAIDCLWSETERKWYILEVNTAPSLDHDLVMGFFLAFFQSEIALPPARRVVLPPTTPQEPIVPETQEPGRIPWGTDGQILVTPDGQRYRVRVTLERVV